ncbi:hypothetical protein [Methylotenera sp. G11]|uniref:hypothetical protein n=1 Tax=Methylotenera sp. G11 TaxID=1506585 RepID=UPI00126A330B|nr:hypothetical protein [Methylotenera sp. G11]
MQYVIKLLNLRGLVFISMYMLLVTLLPLTDFDYFWHLKTGEYIVKLGALPQGDIFSFTHFNQPWVLHEWLFEVALYGMFVWLGPFGVKLLTASLAMAALAITYLTLKRFSATPSIAFGLLLAACIPFGLGIAPRPQLVTYVLFASFLYALLHYKYSQASRHLFILPLLMVIWVNAHGGYLAGILLFGLFAVCEWANYLIFYTHDLKRQHQLCQLTIAAAATIAASAINPEFISHWLYPFQVAGMDVTRQISEWKSPGFQDWGTRSYLLIVLAFFISYTYMPRKPDLTELAIPTFFMLLGFIAIRHVPLATLTLMPFIAIASARINPEGACAAWHQSRLLQCYKKWIGSGKQINHREHWLNWLSLLVIALGLTAYYPVYNARIENQINAILPVKATDFIKSTGISGHMFNSYNFGGYLIYRLCPEQKVFIDGRADMYGDDFVNEYVKIAKVQPGWEQAFDKYDIDYVITGLNEPLSQLLRVRGDFRLVYADSHHSVLVRNVPRYADIIAKYAR